MIERSEIIIETISNNVRKAHLIVIGNYSMLRRVVRYVSVERSRSSRRARVP